MTALTMIQSVTPMVTLALNTTMPCLNNAVTTIPRSSLLLIFAALALVLEAMLLSLSQSQHQSLPQSQLQNQPLSQPQSQPQSQSMTVPVSMTTQLVTHTVILAPNTMMIFQNNAVTTIPKNSLLLIFAVLVKVSQLLQLSQLQLLLQLSFQKEVMNLMRAAVIAHAKLDLHQPQLSQSALIMKF
jgi:hypothetical protein